MSNRAFWAAGIGLVLVASAALIWTLGPNVAIYVESGLRETLPACSSDSDDCAAAFARLGQAGDLFGPISSLFSGIALLAVAMTIWVDVSSRRVSRKPLVICNVNDADRITFDEPISTTPRGVRIKVGLDVKALNDVALNVLVQAHLIGGSWSKEVGKVAIPAPLADGGPPETATLAIRLDADDIKRFVQTYSQGNELLLEISAQCESLEGVKWTTGVAYSLHFRDSDGEKLKALEGSSEVCEGHWANQATVQADHRVKPGSWRHSR